MLAYILKRIHLALAVGLLTIGMSSGAATAATWKCYTYIPSPTHAVYKGMVKIMERFRDATGGAIDFKCNVGGSLPIDANSIVPALANGVIDLATDGFVSGVVPVAGISGLPGLFGSLEDVEKGLDVAMPTLKSAFEKSGVVVLGKYIYPRQVIWSKGPVDTLADLSGKKVRVTTVEQSEFVKTFGGVPITIGTAEVATSLQRGIVSVVLTAASGGGRLWIDLLDHTSDLGPNFNVSYILVSKRRFDALPAEQQEALRKISMEEGQVITKQLFEENASLLKDFAANKGLTITPANPEEEKKLTEAMTGYWDSWAKERGDLAVKVLADVKAALGR